jgi:AcrR family transcriptional regulator
VAARSAGNEKEMNQIAFARAARPMTRRAMAKQNTRDALIGAGKELFAERGYEAATVRDIASRAGLSTGAVFANFDDKAHLFSDIQARDTEAMAALMRSAANDAGDILRTLMAVLTTGYEFHLQQLPFFQAVQARSWTQDRAQDAKTRPYTRQMIAILQQALQQGVERRELRAGIDIELVADLIWHAYLSNYRLAIFDDFDPDQLSRRLSRQLEVILRACRG